MIKPFLSSAFLAAHSAIASVIFVVPSEPLLTVGADAGLNPIDLDGNGSIDFQFAGSDISGTAFLREGNNRFIGLAATPPNIGGSGFPLQDNTMVQEIAPNGLAWIGSGSTILASCRSTGCTGLFYSQVAEGVTPLRGLLGVEFEAEDGTHYGYFDLTFNPGVTTGFINGWAYETEPGQGINAVFIPEPSLAGLFGLASGALFLRRRRRSAPASSKDNHLTLIP